MENTLNNNPNTAETAEELMKKFDKNSKSRNFTGAYKIGYKVLFIIFALYVLSTALIFKRLTTYTKLPLFLGLALFIGYVKYPACEKDALKENYVPWYDVLLATLSLGSCLYYVFTQDAIIYSGGIINTVDVIVGVIGILTIIELCRRAVGIPLLVVVGLFITYAFIWFMKKPETAFRNLIYGLFYNVENGVLSTPISVCCSFIVIFIIFGAFLEKTGIGNFFVDLANSLVGASAGGPAKVAVISSALEGMYSGSSVANTVGSGSITIPVMKSAGYKPEFAAAVEAAASTGGQIMPPIMGAAAFLMSQITTVPYATIITCAILPAILYFSGIFIMVHLEAKKTGLKGLPKEAIPNFFKLILKKGYLLIPIIALIICMNDFTPAMSACFAILFAMCVSFIDPDLIDNLLSKKKSLIKKTLLSFILAIIPIAAYFISSVIISSQTTSRSLAVAISTAVICSVFNKNDSSPLKVKLVGEALYSGTNNAIGVIVACAMAGIVSGVVQMTGLGSTLVTIIVPIAQKSLIVALFLTMICCIVLGMGVPTTANYVIMATIMAPILTKAGIEVPLAAHMFVFYFGIVADITPPVALAAYAGSAIAKSNPLKTSITATKLAIAAFIVPYVFALNPSMLLIDAVWYEAVLTVITSIIGMYGVSLGLQGFTFGKINLPLRILSAIGGLLLIIPGLVTDSIGILIIGGVLAYQYFFVYKKKDSQIS
ncbi:MAG: TRAP transporter fused permease subunit [Clostridia bacterium]|nr:TRAP transporter fused permease subunit [Clostridia bacterium]